MTILKPTWLGIAIVLSACGGSPDLFAVSTPAVTETVRIGFRTVEIRDVSLPTFAASDEIVIQDTDGKLVTESGKMWADAPERAVALELSRNLARLSGARVAPEPWPFEALPDARVDVRFETLVAQTDGQFRASGQYFVSTEDSRRERSGIFDLATPYAQDEGVQAIAKARGQIVLDLAELIARRGLR